LISSARGPIGAAPVAIVDGSESSRSFACASHTASAIAELGWAIYAAPIDRPRLSIAPALGMRKPVTLPDF